MNFDGRMLSNIGVLAAIVESGSFARAAQGLGLTASGVSRAIGRLESNIGVRLFERTTRSVKLTDEGRRLYEEISPLMAGIGDAVTLAASASVAVRGRLRVNVDSFFSRTMLAPHITQFLHRYPDLSVELIVREELGNLVTEGFDLAVRFGQPPPSSLVARKLLETRIITVAAPSYVKQRGRPEMPADLARHECIQTRDSMTGLPLEWVYHSGRKIIRVKTAGRLVLTEAGTLLNACLAGAGIARIKASGIRDLLEKGELVELLPEFTGQNFPLYALYPSRRLPAAKVQAFLDFLTEIPGGDKAPQSEPGALS